MADSIFQTLTNCLSGTTLTLPANTFGSGNLEDVLNQYFAGGTLVVDNVSLEQVGDTTVTFQKATGASAPLNGMTLSATFSQGGDGVDLVLTATPPTGWIFSASWPPLKGGWIDNIAVSNATLTLTSVAQGALSAGLSFSGTLALGGTWSPVEWLLGGTLTLPCSGAIGQQGTAPSFDFTIPITGQIAVPVLGTLTLNLEIASTVVSGTPQTSIALQSTIPLAEASVGVTIDLSNVGAGTIPITTDLSQLSSVTLADFASLLPDVDFSSALPSTSVFDPGTILQPQSLSFVLDAAQQQVTSVQIVLGSTGSWTITKGVSVGPITIQFTVTIADKVSTLAATLQGDVNFNTTGIVGGIQLAANYPGWTFSGGLLPDSQINVTDLLNLVLPSPINATLELDKLDFTVEPLSSGAFTLSTGLTGDWSISVGVATVSLTSASLDLDRAIAKNSGVSTTGSISVTGGISLPSHDHIGFTGQWTLPQQFSLSGSFPDISLSSIASAISGTTLPSGMPDVALTNGGVSIQYNGSDQTYDFGLAMSAAINQTNIGTGILVVQKTSGAFGYLAGFEITESWSPASLWSDLGTILGNLSFSDAGMFISTLPSGTTVNLPSLTMPSLPATVAPGVTFFASLALTGDILGPLSQIFSGDITFDLLATIDADTPADSEIEALLTASASTNAISFTSLGVAMSPGSETFTLSAAATLNIQHEQLELVGTGSIALAGAVTFTILIENWAEPFGISGLTVNEFGLQVGIKDSLLTVGLLGSFLIGTGTRQFTLVVGGELADFEDPDAIVFSLKDSNQADPLMLSDLITQFTTLDVSDVPVLSHVGFTDLSFYVVADPAGFTIGDYTYPAGIGIAADIFVYSWQAKFNLQVNDAKGIIASGSINDPISIGGVFALSSADGTTGPSGSIDTANIPGNYFALNGKVELLGVIGESIDASASGSSFDFTLNFQFLGVTESLSCALVDDKNFSASAGFGFDLNISLGPLIMDGYTLIPAISVHDDAASLSLAVAVNPQVIAELDVAVYFSWGSLKFDPSFTLTADDIGSDLSNLWGQIKSWLQNNVQVLFADVLKDASAWIAAIENELSALAGDIDNIANALANFFQVSYQDAAAFLKQLGFAFEDIVDALVKWFGVTTKEAAAALEALWNDCAMSNAENAAYNPPSEGRNFSTTDLRFELTNSPRGQRLLEAYYIHGDEVWGLLRRHPRLRMRLTAIERSPRGASDLRALCDIGIRSLFAVAPEASPPLRVAISELLPEIAHYRTMTHRQAAKSLREGH